MKTPFQALLQQLAMLSSGVRKAGTVILLYTGFLISESRVEAQEYLRPAGLPSDIQPITIYGLGMEMLPIPAGEFMMGSPITEKGRSREESQHKVRISRHFWMGKTEVTQGQWQKVMGRRLEEQMDASKGDKPHGVGENVPVYYVTWEEAMEFCNKLDHSQREAGLVPAGFRYTLPSEAEWEYACRAGTTSAFHFGEELDVGKANLASRGTLGRSAKPVGSYRPNPFGLHDMHGNVSEWCYCKFGNYPSGLVADPVGAGLGVMRVYRGGAWITTLRSSRSASREKYLPHSSRSYVGFRVCLSPVVRDSQSSTPSPDPSGAGQLVGVNPSPNPPANPTPALPPSQVALAKPSHPLPGLVPDRAGEPAGALAVFHPMSNFALSLDLAGLGKEEKNKLCLPGLLGNEAYTYGHVDLTLKKLLGVGLGDMTMLYLSAKLTGRDQDGEIYPESILLGVDLANAVSIGQLQDILAKQPALGTGMKVELDGRILKFKFPGNLDSQDRYLGVGADGKSLFFGSSKGVVEDAIGRTKTGTEIPLGLHTGTRKLGPNYLVRLGVLLVPAIKERLIRAAGSSGLPQLEGKDIQSIIRSTDYIAAGSYPLDANTVSAQYVLSLQDDSLPNLLGDVIGDFVTKREMMYIRWILSDLEGNLPKMSFFPLGNELRCFVRQRGMPIVARVCGEFGFHLDPIFSQHQGFPYQKPNGLSPEMNRFIVPGLGIELLPVPSGQVILGSRDKEVGRVENETLRQVTISRPYWLGRHEVTVGQWYQVMGTRPSFFKQSNHSLPVEGVSWQDAMEFCKKLDARERQAVRIPTGYAYTLPTEAEWERACRAGGSTPIYSGELTIKGERHSPELDRIAWYGGNSGVVYKTGQSTLSWKEMQYNHYRRAGTHPVGLKEPNNYGFHDMIGNVWEWCYDRYERVPNLVATDPIGSKRGQQKETYFVVKGGGWNEMAMNCRSATRTGGEGTKRTNIQGFRVCLSPVARP